MTQYRLDCPNCKSAKTYLETQTFEGVFDSAQVVCPVCGMRGPVVSGTQDVRKKAEQLWNSLPRR